MSSETWKLYYWDMCPGRGEYVRIVFEEAGVQFLEDRDNILEKVIKGGMEGFPAFAPPVITRGDFKLSQTPVICEYLGKHFNLYPASDTDVWHARQINLTIHDFQADGRNVFHAKQFTASYFGQEAETQGHIDWFRKERLPRWLLYFEKLLQANDNGRSFVIGDKLTYVDLGLLQVLRNAANQFSDEWIKMDIPLIKAFKQRMEARPNLAAYFKSDRCQPFEGNSMN